MRTRGRKQCVSCGALCLLVTCCNSFDEPISSEPRTVQVVPLDDREVVRSEVTHLPVSGGTLAYLDGNGLVVADPSRDRILVVLLNGWEGDEPRKFAVELPEGSQPGRVEALESGSFAVVLRGTGEVARFRLESSAGEPALALGDAAQLSEVWRREVCSAPRGVDSDAELGRLYVACAGGELVTLDLASGERSSVLRLDDDLRDVVAADEQLYVSRFRSAEVLLVRDEQIYVRTVLPPVHVRSFDLDGDESERVFSSTVAYRMQAMPGGGVVVAHQQSDTGEVGTDTEQGEQTEAVSSPYGGGGCDGIVQAAVTRLDANANVLSSASLSGVTLPVDIAVSPDGSQLVVADAGVLDPSTPTQVTVRVGSDENSDPQFERSGLFRSGGMRTFSVDRLRPARRDEPMTLNCELGRAEGAESIAVSSVLYLENGRAVSFDDEAGALYRSGLSDVYVSLGGVDLFDTGHRTFHRDGGGGIACASCHPEGADDGHVWHFEGLGARRTQNLAVPLQRTEPFHWDGELADVDALMAEVFVDRMGGVPQSEARVAAFRHWLFEAPKPVHLDSMSEAAERGKSLFESEAVGCASCHRGAALTDNQNYVVRQGAEALQVPSLVGVGAHPPYMHDGCAETLRERFSDEACGGGDSHGRTSQLADEQVEDLVAYLRTL